MYLKSIDVWMLMKQDKYAKIKRNGAPYPLPIHLGNKMKVCMYGSIQGARL